MCAGLDMVAANEELSNYFSDDEMVFYTNNEEMVDKALFYTKPSNESLCRKMKTKARVKAEREHNWECRFDNVFNSLNINYL